MTTITPQVIEDCIKGKRKAQNMLYAQYCDAMYNICLRMLKNSADAEDLLVKSFTDVFSKLNQFRMEASIGAWIKRIVINNCITFLRAKRTMDEWDEKYDSIEDDYAPEDESEYSIDAIKMAMNKLSDGYRTIINLYLFEGLDHIEISEYLNISVSSSKVQYHRAKKKLIDILKSLNE